MTEERQSASSARPRRQADRVVRWREADHEARRGPIVDVALSLLHEHGLKMVTMRRVAERLGVGVVTLYTYIRRQDKLHREMVQRGFEMLHADCMTSVTLGTPEG